MGILVNFSSKNRIESSKNSPDLLMSQDFHHHGIYSFSNGYERSPMNHQIRRDKLIRPLQSFDENPPPPPLVGIEDEESAGTLHYETAGMLSEMFNFPSSGGVPPELLENYRQPPPPARQPPPSSGHDWSNRGEFNPESAMHLFLMNPQPRSPSPTPQPPPTVADAGNVQSSTLHMLLPNPSTNSIQGFNVNNFGTTTPSPQQNFTWVGHGTNNNNNINPSEGLSLSLSSSLQQMEAAKAEEFRMSELYYNNQAGAGVGGGAGPNSSSYKNFHVGFGSSVGMVNVLRNSKYSKPAQDLLEEFCSVGRGHLGQFRNNKLSGRQTLHTSNNYDNIGEGKNVPSLSAADRIEHQRRKVKLMSMLDEVDRRCNHYCEQMQMVVNSFDLVMGFGSAVPYTSLAQKAMSRHFRCLKEAIAAQLKSSCELLGEKDAGGTSGLTKGETPRLKLLEQSLRQQRAFHQMGMLEQEAWRPQRGLPERSVSILRAWLFEHFLHPYPSDADKHLLARQTGLSRNQISNWFINARVRLWKPMVEEMYQQEANDRDQDQDDDDQSHDDDVIQTNNNSQPPPPQLPTSAADGRRSDHLINAIENDPSSSINRQQYFGSENQASSYVAPPPTSFLAVIDDTCRHGSVAADDHNHHYGTTTADSNIGSSTIIRFGPTTSSGAPAAGGDVSLTLGLRHVGNAEKKTPSFSLRDFGAC